MGRITIFVTESCSYCIRAKHALKERNIPYVEISVSKYPQRRNDMISLSNDQYTVPQVFFNSKHIGGCTELLAMLEEWDKNCEMVECRESSEKSIVLLEKRFKSPMPVMSDR